MTRGLSIEEIKKSGFDTYFVDHTTALYPIAASGMPFTATYFQSKGDPITDLIEDLAADGTIAQEQLSPHDLNVQQICRLIRWSDLSIKNSSCDFYYFIIEGVLLFAVI